MRRPRLTDDWIRDGETWRRSSEPGKTRTDDQEVEVKVGDETKKATLRDLKRLFGQEAALTQKSQKGSPGSTAQSRHRRRTSLHCLSRAIRWTRPILRSATNPTPSWTCLGPSSSADGHRQPLRLAAVRTPQPPKQTLTSSRRKLDGHMREATVKQQQAQNSAAQEAIRSLSDPTSPHHVEGWGKPLYDDLMVAFTQSQERSYRGRQPGSWPCSRLSKCAVHMAMLYAKAQEDVKAATAKVKKVVETPKRVLKPGPGRNDSSDKARAANEVRHCGNAEERWRHRLGSERLFMVGATPRNNSSRQEGRFLCLVAVMKSYWTRLSRQGRHQLHHHQQHLADQDPLPEHDRL